jgi:cell wall-active antibiotic response 4TMS protein YvqF/B-box zinc finger protein
MNCANHPDREHTAFCQNCGKPLCQECTRVVGSAVFCEPCLASKLAGTGAPPAGGSYTYSGSDGGVNYTVSGTIPPPVPPPIPGEPNPGLAALLGFIPGVGAMYNGQYAKGVVHLVVFAILVSLANENGIFGLFIAGWVCYQVIEAHHTAKARRDGTPLPNPFGLNDLGERLGFGKAWPGAQPGAPGAASGATPPTAAGYPPPPGYQPPSAASWNTPWDSYSTSVPPVPPYGVPGMPGYPVDPNLAPNLAPPTGNRFPAGAIWLIGLGCLFLIGNSGLFHGFPVHRIVPFFLIALGVWLFVRKMTDTGTSLADDGTPAYRYRLFCALRSSVWVTLIGVLFLLDSFDILSWGHSWPVLIIVGGLMIILRRVSYPVVPYPYPDPYSTPPAAAPTPPVTSIVPVSQHDQEGR